METKCEGGCRRGECSDCDAVYAQYKTCAVCGGPCIETRPSGENEPYCSDDCAGLCAGE